MRFLRVRLRAPKKRVILRETGIAARQDKSWQGCNRMEYAIDVQERRLHDARS